MAETIWGRQAVREALRGRRQVLAIWCTARARDSLDWLPGEASVEEPDKLAGRSGTDQHQGVVADVAPYPYAAADSLLGRDRGLLVALDEVTDPHNLGAVARVAECAGADGLLIPGRRSASVTGAVCRASAGAVEHLPIARVRNLAEALLAARRPGLWSYAAAAGAEQRYDTADYRDGTVFVLGAEGRGLRPRVRDACDVQVAIPMGGCVQSLNVSTAAAVLLFEAVRQRYG
jgi:23S rRNA (guanosine2251-2'-O)-methyltransferase